ncbi:N-acetylmuramoyl-L-alanine amidase [Azospirillum thermophilum]|uniref:N-acetylmuramoyl-L-alanine amidase n=1 Tax=Azospirillum thermophilum TaxID=2202148 RepID=A0A2S2CQ08_9PROT|nr:N-acetylmuramoyl-L-alanine amidase [Azospirillum thermophilum]AWK86539.1 N-acetylmuramoyl-L-alanine amidase [Azospirillum thermophilum]
MPRLPFLRRPTRRWFGTTAGAALAAAMVLLWALAAGLASGLAAGLTPASAQTTAALMAPPVARPAVIDARLGLHPDMTRFVLEVTEAVPFRITTLANPYRIVVDLPELAWPGGSVPVEGKGIVSRYRYAVVEPGTLRLTFETAGPAKVRDAMMLPPRDGRQSRLVLDIERVSAEEFRRTASAAPPTPRHGGEVRPVPVVPTPAPPPPIIPAALPAAPPAAPTQAPQAPRAPSKAEKPLIVLDPGHGGVDPGAIGVNGIHEKDITLAAAREAKRQLEASGRYRVLLTRDKDVFIRLRERVAIAREADADLFISLHADSIGSGSIRGLSIYTLSDKASDREAETLAAKENRADALAGLDLSAENDLVATILIDLAQRDTRNHSKRFARTALEQLGREVKLIPNKPHRQAGFAVLTAPDIPSVLIEMGYLSSRQDVNLLTTPEHRERLGRALTRAVDAYFRSLSSGRRG